MSDPNAPTVDESEYLRQAKQAFLRVEQAFDDVDVDVADCERATGDVVAIAFASGVRCVLNTQRPTRQIWLAANAEAWHFAWQPEAQAWLDDRRDDAELFATLRQLVRTHSGLELSF